MYFAIYSYGFVNQSDLILDKRESTVAYKFNLELCAIVFGAPTLIKQFLRSVSKQVLYVEIMEVYPMEAMGAFKRKFRTFFASIGGSYIGTPMKYIARGES